MPNKTYAHRRKLQDQSVRSKTASPPFITNYRTTQSPDRVKINLGGSSSKRRKPSLPKVAFLEQD